MQTDISKENEEKEFKKKNYLEKAKKILKWVCGILIFDFITYIIAAIYGAYDFGIIFEIVTFIFVLLTISAINSFSSENAKNNILMAMIPTIFLLLYDFVDLFSHFEEIVEVLININYLYYYIIFDLVDVFLLAIFVLMFLSYKNICKSMDDKRYEESTDWFYDKK